MSSPATERDPYRDFFAGAGTAMRPADLDFVTFNEEYELREVANNPDLDVPIGLLDTYRALIDGNRSLALHKTRDLSLLHGDIEASDLRKVFGSVKPCPVETESEDDNPHPPLDWLVVVMEVKDSDMIRQGDGTYNCSIRGQTIRLSEDQKRLIIPFRRFLEPWPKAQVTKQEMTTIKQALGDLRGYGDKLMTYVNLSKALATKLEERYDMMACHLQSLSKPAPVPRSTDCPLRPRETSPVNSSVDDPQGDIEYTHPDQDSSSTDDSSDESSDESSIEDTEMQDAQHERPEKHGTDILPEIQPVPQQREETRETKATPLNRPASTSNPQGSGWSMTELPKDTVIHEIDDDEVASSMNRPKTSKRKRNNPTTEFNFITDLRSKHVPWDRVTAEYNRVFGVNRTQAALQVWTSRWKNPDSVEKKAKAPPRESRNKRRTRNDHSLKIWTTSPIYAQSRAGTPPTDDQASRETGGSVTSGPSRVSTT